MLFLVVQHVTVCFKFFCELRNWVYDWLRTVLPLALNNYLHSKIFSSLRCLSKSLCLGLKDLKYSALENIIIGGLLSDKGFDTVIIPLKICTKCGILCMLGSMFLPGTSMLSKITALVLLLGDLESVYSCSSLQYIRDRQQTRPCSCMPKSSCCIITSCTLEVETRGRIIIDSFCFKLALESCSKSRIIG